MYALEEPKPSASAPKNRSGNSPDCVCGENVTHSPLLDGLNFALCVATSVQVWFWLVQVGSTSKIASCAHYGADRVKKKPPPVLGARARARVDEPPSRTAWRAETPPSVIS
jgi:hypothetical protein